MSLRGSYINTNEALKNLESAYDRINSKKIDKYKEPLIQLRQLSLSIAQSLFLNNYEVNLIEISYLKLWSYDKTIPTIQILRLLTIYPPRFHPLIKSYFGEEPIDILTYFIFICFFTFYDVRNILGLMLSICHISSNYCITQEQVNVFLDKFNFSETMYSDLMNHLDHHKIHMTDCNQEPFSIKSFANYFLDNPSFITFVQSFRLLNVYNITDFPQLFESINQRKCFYINNNGNKNGKTPKEACVYKCYRIFFTDLPPPYSYDYYPSHINEDIYIHITINIKQYFVNGIFRSTGVRSSHYSSKRGVSANYVSSGRPRVLSDGYLSLITIGSNYNPSKSTSTFTSPKFATIPGNVEDFLSA